MFQKQAGSFMLASLVFLGLVAGTVSCTPKTPHEAEATVNPQFDSNNPQPVVPLSSFGEISKSARKPFYSIEKVTDETTTIIYDDTATKPCRFEVPTKSIELAKSNDGTSSLKLRYKEGVDPSRIVSCGDLTADISHIELQAEPGVAAQFAR